MTSTGDDTVVRDPMPTCPLVFNPHPYSAPIDVIANECDAPAVTLLQLVVAGPLTSTGDETVTVDKLPSGPFVFEPHAYNRPVEVIASE